MSTLNNKVKSQNKKDSKKIKTSVTLSLRVSLKYSDILCNMTTLLQPLEILCVWYFLKSFSSAK